MGEEHPRTRRRFRVLACILTGGVGFFVGALLGPLPSVYGQRGAELGTVLLDNDRLVGRRFFLLPGMPTGMHSHDREYLRIWALRRTHVRISHLQTARGVIEREAHNGE